MANLPGFNRPGARPDESGLEKLTRGESYKDAPQQDDNGRSAPDAYPAEDAALSGTRVAQRMDNKYPTEPPGGGEGNGRNVGKNPFGKAKPDVTGFAS